MQIPKDISLTKNAQYCIACFYEGVDRFFEDEKTFYRCSSCKHEDPRSLVMDDKVTSWVDEEARYWHESVGVLIQNTKGEIFCILRKIYPFVYALPAGHLDAGEDPEQAAARETREEIGLDKLALKNLGRFPIYGDKCRRGCDDHMWNLFLHDQADDFEPQLSDEALTWKWLSKNELQSRDDIAYPLKYIIEHHGHQIQGQGKEPKINKHKTS